MKAGQISLVLILIVVFVLLLALPYLISHRSQEPIAGDVQTVESYVAGVLRQSSEYCLAVLGAHGGRLDPTEFADLPFGKVQLAYRSIPVFLSQLDLTEELESCIEHRLSVCADGFSALEEFGSDVDVGKPDVTAMLAAQNTRIVLDMPVTVTNGDMRRTYRRFEYDIPVRLARLHSAIDRTSIDRKAYPKPTDIDLTSLGGRDTNTSIISSVRDQVMVLRDHESSIDNSGYVFVAANSFGE